MRPRNGPEAVRLGEHQNEKIKINNLMSPRVSLRSSISLGI